MDAPTRADIAALLPANPGLLQAAGLTPRESKVLCMRFGINLRTSHTLQQIGDTMGITRERVRQIEVKALRKLRGAMKKTGLGADDF